MVILIVLPDLASFVDITRSGILGFWCGGLLAWDWAAWFSVVARGCSANLAAGFDLCLGLELGSEGFAAFGFEGFVQV